MNATPAPVTAAADALPPTLRLLCASLRPAPEAATWDALRQLPPAEWDALVDTALRLNVAAYFFHRLQPHLNAQAVPPAAWQVLRNAHNTIALRNMELFKVLSRVLAALRGAAIPVIVLKGAHLAQTIYERATLRPMSDLDLLVHPADLPRVHDALTPLGFSSLEPDAAQATHHAAYVLPGEPATLVEIHDHVQPPDYAYRIGLPGLWQRAQPCAFFGVQALGLAPDDLLLHTCFHVACHHKFNRIGLKNFVDMAEIIRRHTSALDWPAIEARAREWGIGNGVFLALRFAHDWLGAAVPADVLHRLHPRPLDAQVWRWAEKRILGEVDDNIGPWSDNMGRLWALPGAAQKSSAIVRSFFPARAAIAQAYGVPPGSARVFLYYPARWGRLLRDYLGQLWRLARHNQATRAWVQREGERNALEDWLAAR